MASPKSDNPVGRPSLYRAEYCEQVIEAGREGKSLTAFAADIEVGRSTINLWMEEHPEFMEAVLRAKSLTASWYEQCARNLAKDGGSSAQATIIVFGLKNMGYDDWKDRQEVQHSGGVNITITPTDADL